MAILLCITQWDVAPWLERLRRLAPERDIRAWPEVGDPADITYAAVWKQPAGILAGLPNLKGIVSLGAGVDHVFADPDLPDVPIARVVDADLTSRMSEWVVLHALMHLRRQRLYDTLQRERRWEDVRPAPGARELRVGVMGLGVLGQDAARKLAVIGFDVAGWSRTPRTVEGIATFSGDGLDAFLARTDLLVALMPLTPETHGILDAALLRKLARDGVFGAPVLMNAGRGGLQVEADILAALDDGTLAAATLDVFETEPLPAGSRLWTHPGVTVTPHVAAISDEDAVGRFVLRQIVRHEQGLGFETPVDRARRY
ncbi:2-hydroxyacid dehydrogenase [Labrys wisconsinensis]|uniref:Glyoxylate/hydroxypyruvate reductase A n=1 Tax=Labrys wisconsinensis TaxID=425677 RepID=A0ABU0IZL7_9HYPH|nr:glyoxylate/hydroxypyruvate reductase A [Labrys wisconsinensis]MDQ0467456.1 glyoxylate/hydroxypyruvate reductase A [Labrys wisconsinensis]